MKVVYITYPWFLDFSIEYIRELSKRVELYVFVLTSEGKLSSTIFNLKQIPENNVKDKYSFDELKDSLKDAELFEAYIKDCKGFEFVFFPKKRVGTKGLQKNRKLGRKINVIGPDVVHFDDVSIELFALPLFIRCKKWVIDVHDPKPHSGEEDWRRKLIRTIMYPKAKLFLTFSQHSKKVFESVYGVTKPVFNLSLVPYTFYNLYKEAAEHGGITGDYILFIGRVSQYKGVEDLLKSFKKMAPQHPGLKLVIAGKWKKNFSVSEGLLEGKNVVIINRFLENEEVASLIRNCRAVVCPYKDATQSGVVMTTFGIKKNVVVSNVGGLPETVYPESGLVYDRTKENGLNEALSSLLLNQKNGLKFKDIKQISPEYNTEKLVKLYQKI